jgi:hypothetical protein
MLLIHLLVSFASHLHSARRYLNLLSATLNSFWRHYNGISAVLLSVWRNCNRLSFMPYSIYWYCNRLSIEKRLVKLVLASEPSPVPFVYRVKSTDTHTEKPHHAGRIASRQTGTSFWT